MRQGCPLSPLVFVLTLEPFLQCLHTDSLIFAVQIEDTQYKLAAIADDVLLFLRTTLPRLIELLGDFQVLAGFKVNYTK